MIFVQSINLYTFSEVPELRFVQAFTKKTPIYALTSQANMSFTPDQHDCYAATDPRINRDLATGLSGKNVVIVGAGSGIGRASAEFIAHAGAKSLACLGLELEDVEETARICRAIDNQCHIVARAVDNKNFEQVQDQVNRLEKDFDGVDVLFMNAGRPPQWLVTAESDADVWWDTVAVSLQGSFNFARAVLPSMQQKRAGRIIFTASSAVHMKNLMSSYVVAKLGQVKLAEIIHAENFKAFGIRCFAIDPGCVKTRFFTDFEDEVLGNKRREGSYTNKGGPLEQKSARNVYTTLKDMNFDTPYLAAGLFTFLAAGKMDSLSGRLFNANVDVQSYLDREEEILRDDLCRSKMNYGQGVSLPRLDY